MRIGIDARAAAEVPAGGGRVVRELLSALAAGDADHEFLLYARERWAESPADPRLRWRRVAAPDPAWHAGAALRASEACDVFLSTNSYLTAWLLRIPSVPVVYDLIAFRPELAPQARAGLIERVTMPLAVRRASALVCISQATADDLVARFPAARGKAHVAPLAADPRFAPDGPDPAPVLARHGIDGPYVLGVGTLEPRKNLVRLIEAFIGLDDVARAGRRLVLVGPIGWEVEPILAAARAHPGLVLTVGHVPEAELPVLYRAADLFAYPSLYEGFGLPVLEAMACGTAVLTSPVSSLPEVAGDTALYADPHDVPTIRAALARALTDPALRARLGAAGVQRARAFSWGRFAGETLAVLEEAGAQK